MDNQESSAGFNDLDRKNAIHIMLGTVVEIATTGKATVNINGKEVPGLMVMAQRAGAHGKSYWLPAKGEQVVILSPFGNLTQGIIAGSIYYGEKNNDNKTDFPDEKTTSLKKIYYPDGTTTSYDSEKQEFSVTFEQNGKLLFSLGDNIFLEIKDNEKNILIKTDSTLKIDAKKIELIATEINVQKR